ncbi:MAG: hypothetical protein R3186_01295 [Ruegeria sp.]|nr:hypothetical protein [Ruegeria sp.]
MRQILVAGILLALAGCQDTSLQSGDSNTVNGPPPNDDLRFVRGYRSGDDDCQLTGETAFTVNFLDDAADLVSCPTGSDADRSLVETYPAREVAQTGGYTVYSIPRR